MAKIIIKELPKDQKIDGKQLKAIMGASSAYGGKRIYWNYSPPVFSSNKNQDLERLAAKLRQMDPANDPYD